MPRYAIVDNLAGGVVLYTAQNDFNPGGNWIQSESAHIGDSWDGEVFTAPSPTPAAYGASLKRVVRVIERMRKNSGITFSGVRYPTDADGKAEAGLKKAHPPAGNRKHVGKNSITTHNASTTTQLVAAISDYLDDVEAYAYDLITSIDVEIANEDLPALEAIAAAFGTGWPSDVIS